MRVAAIGLALTLALSGQVGAAEPQPFLRGSWHDVQQQHKGQPLIVHFWGLTCTPCLAELPEWGRFVREAEGAKIVMVAADPIPVEPRDLEKMLAKAGLTGLESWRFADSFSERLEYEVDPDWQGELPFTVLIGKAGQKTTMLGAADFKSLHAWADAQSSATPDKSLR